MTKQPAESLTSTLPTTLFIVDDDPIVLRRWTKESLQNTALGVLTAADLPSAVEYLHRDYSIGAVLADIHFRSSTHDETHNLRDGLDFLAFVQARYPSLPLYVFSMDTVDRQSRAHAEEKGLQIRGWYDKILQPGIKSPWSIIERDLVCSALRGQSSLRDAVRVPGYTASDLVTDDNVAEKVRANLSTPRRTFLQQSLSEDTIYQIREPVEVQCWQDDDGWFVARAISLSLLLDGRGEDPVEALQGLRDMLIAEKISLDREPVDRIVGYARFLKDALDKMLVASPDTQTKA